jgi:DNA-binding phage protein
MTMLTPYKSYNWKDRDPVFDQLRTIISDSGMSYKQIHEESGVSLTTLYRHFTQCSSIRTRHDVVAAIASAAGFDFVLQKRSSGKIIKFEPRHQRKLKRAAG